MLVVIPRGMAAVIQYVPVFVIEPTPVMHWITRLRG